MEANLKKEARIGPCGVVGLWKSSSAWLMLIRWYTVQTQYRRGSRKSGACLELGEKGPGDGNSKGCFFLFHCVCEKHKKVRMRTLSRVPVAGPWCEWKMKLQEAMTWGDILREFQTECWQYKE